MGFVPECGYTYSEGNTYNYTGRVQTIHPRKTHGTADLYQLTDVSQTVGGLLVTAKALVVLATIHPRV